MGEKKVTVMILKVDLQCNSCYKNVKKLLCKFPEIKDRIFDQKSNTVMIKVISCDPTKIRNKLCHKGRGAIKSIEIKDSEDPKPVPTGPPKRKEVVTPPPAAKPESPIQAPAAKPESPIQPPPLANAPNTVQNQPPKFPEPAIKAPEPAPKATEWEPKQVEPVSIFGSEPIPTCCEQCYGGRAGGPCYYGYGQPPVYYGGYYTGRTAGYAQNGLNRVCHPGRCAENFSEDNPVGCSVM